MTAMTTAAPPSRGRGSVRTSAIVALVAVLVAAACTGGPEAPGEPRWTPPPHLSEMDVIAILADSGIGVVREPSSRDLLKPTVGPASPILLTAWQAAGLGRDLASGGGIPGRALDELGTIAGVPSDAPPFSFFVAGWLAEFDSAGAAKARELVGNQDWTHPESIVFPRLVLLLLVSDIARDAAQESASTTGARSREATLFAAAGSIGFPAAVEAAGTVCPNLSAFVDSILTKLFNTLKLEEGGSSFFRILTRIWNAAIDLARVVVRGLIDALTAPVVAAIKTTLAIVGTVSLISSFLAGWTVDVALKPGSATHWAHPGEGPKTGAFIATVIPAAGSWPDYLASCVSDAGIALPDLSPLGKGVTWEMSGGDGGSATSMDIEVGSDGIAQLNYALGQEDGKGDVEIARMTATLYVERFTEADIDALFDAMVFSGTAGSILSALLDDQINAANQAIRELAVASGSGGAYIGFHVPPPPTPTPGPTFGPTDPPGSRSPGSPTPSPTPAPTARPTPRPLPDPCSIVDSSDAAAVLGTPVGPEIPATGSAVGSLACFWYNEDPDEIENYAQLVVYFYPGAQFLTRQSYIETGEPISDVAIGGAIEAFFVRGDPFGGELNMLVGDVRVLMTAVRGLPGASTGRDIMEARLRQLGGSVAAALQ